MTMTMTMTIKRLIFFALGTVLLFGAPASAQQYLLSNTTLNGAITSTQTTLVLTSASASTGSSFGAPAAGQCLWIDRELMTIQSVASTTMTVQRARGGVAQGTGASPHATLAVVLTGACSAFKTSDPVPAGNYTCSAQPAPWVNVNNGNVWWCDLVTNKWAGTNATPFTYSSTRVAQ